MSQKKLNRFSPVGALVDALLGSFLSTLLRATGITGKYTPQTSPTCDFNLLFDWFLRGFVYIFIMFYIITLLGAWPTRGIFLEAYRKDKKGLRLIFIGFFEKLKGLKKRFTGRRSKKGKP